MRKITLFIVFLLSCIGSYAQNINTDSLKLAMENYSKRDSTKAQKIYEYSYSIRTTNPEKAMFYAKQSLDITLGMKWPRGIIYLSNYISGLYGIATDYSNATVYGLRALELADSIHDMPLAQSCHRTLSELNRVTGNDSLATFHANEYYKIARANNDSFGILEALMLKSNLLTQKGKYEEAEKKIDEAMKLAVTMQDEYHQSRLLAIKSECLGVKGEYQLAINTCKQCIVLNKKIENYHDLAWAHVRISNFFARMNKKDSAYYYANEALQLSKEYNLSKELNDAYDILYKIHYQFGDYKSAFEYRLLYDSMYNQTFSMQVGQDIEKARHQKEQEKKDAIAKVETLRKEAEVKRTKNLQYMAIGFMLLIAIFLYWNNRQKQKAKTKIEAAYGELKSTQSQLIQSEKMASLGELTAGIAHEIQNPLNFMNNFSEVNSELIEELKTGVLEGNKEEVIAIANDIKANEEKINHHGKRADAIVKGMLQHSRKSTGQKEPTDVNKLADEYLRLSYHGLRAKDKNFNATLKTDFDESIGKINIVPQDIGRVLLNLYNNAFYAVSEKIKLQDGSYQPIVSVHTKKIKDKSDSYRIEITVKDNGNGIPQKVVDKIFQPFFTTKPTGEGTGLGLSLSYDIIKAHSGDIKVETKEGEGSEFVIQLPIA